METNSNNSNKNSLQKLEEWISNFRKTATGPKMQVFDAAADKLLDLIYFLDKSFANNSNETENNESEELKDMENQTEYKVGDWVVFDHTTNVITELPKNRRINVEIKRYAHAGSKTLITQHVPIPYIHKWTLDDARPGDVLTFETENQKWTFIYNKIVKKSADFPFDTLKYYALLSEEGFVDKGLAGLVEDYSAENFHPATQEEQDVFFSEMKESGYEWDWVKLEMKKTVETPADAVNTKTEKHKPLFKIGDWVVHDLTTGVPTIRKIVDMTNKSYVLDGDCINRFYFKDLEESFRLWTIEDARPGDVLTLETENRKWTFIYNKIVKKSAVNPFGMLKYYALLSEEEFIDNGIANLAEDCSAANFHPATQVEQELFFSEMKESGYEWDCVKLEMKKTVETPADTVNTKTEKHKPLFKIGDWVVHDLTTGVPAIRKIIDMTNKSYVLNGDCFNCFYFKDLEDSFRLWTIEDARPGDILAAHECYVMFKEIDGLNIRCFCTYHYMNHQSFYLNTLQNKTAFHPATEEECKEMLTKMKEEGYAFDPVHNDLIAVQNETPDESKEPDDETIRKTLINLVRCNERSGYTLLDNVKTSAMIEWLEKQKETNTKSSVALSIMKFLDENTQKMCLSNMECEDLENAVINSDWAKVYRYMKKKLEPNDSKPAIESQKESAANNSQIKPKFKEGSYAVSDIDKKARLVSEVHCNETNCYYLINGLVYNIEAYDKLHHNWTIADARPGDILVASDNSVFIFSGIKDNYALYYAAVTLNGFIQISDGMHKWEDIQGCYPATNKQCQLLIELMNRIGYAWDETVKMPIKSLSNNRSACKALFNIGDWLATKQHYALKIIGITKDKYIISENSDGDEIESTEEIDFVDKNYHIWSIDDARNGDILASKDWIFIFRKSDHTKPTKDVRSYCHYDIETDSFKEDDEFVTLPLDMKVQPATAEQYNTFFKKMKESGYDWDDSEKELNKLED